MIVDEHFPAWFVRVPGRKSELGLAHHLMLRTLYVERFAPGEAGEAMRVLFPRSRAFRAARLRVAHPRARA